MHAEFIFSQRVTETYKSIESLQLRKDSHITLQLLHLGIKDDALVADSIPIQHRI